MITLADHVRAVATHLDLCKRLEPIEQSWGLGQHRLTPQESEMVEEVRWSNTVVQLRIETFYFSGQKALDDIAQLIEEQLGRSKTKVEAHSHLAHRLPEKAAELGLAAPPHDLLKQIDGLSVSIKRFRNKYVAHTGDPSLTRGMHLRPNGTTTMTAGEAGVESEPPKRLMAQLNAYVEAVLDYIGVAPV